MDCCKGCETLQLDYVCSECMGLFCSACTSTHHCHAALTCGHGGGGGGGGGGRGGGGMHFGGGGAHFGGGGGEMHLGGGGSHPHSGGGGESHPHSGGVGRHGGGYRGYGGGGRYGYGYGGFPLWYGPNPYFWGLLGTSYMTAAILQANYAAQLQTLNEIEADRSNAALSNEAADLRRELNAAKKQNTDDAAQQYQASLRNFQDTIAKHKVLMDEQEKLRSADE